MASQPKKPCKRYLETYACCGKTYTRNLLHCGDCPLLLKGTQCRKIERVDETVTDRCCKAECCENAKDRFARELPDYSNRREYRRILDLADDGSEDHKAQWVNSLPRLMLNKLMYTKKKRKEMDDAAGRLWYLYSQIKAEKQKHDNNCVPHDQYG